MMIYLWLKTGHIIAVIAWMAGLLYLPRLFVYHASLVPGDASIPQSETFKIMERRLLRAIMTPAMIATWMFGVALAWQSGFYETSWLQLKVALVVGMTGIHGWLAYLVRNFASNRNKHGHRFYRLLNEAPTLLMIAIVALVVIKPFMG